MKKLSIISFSGDFDKLTAVFTLATGAAAVGYEVNIFFTFWGLDAIKVKQGRAFVGGEEDIDLIAYCLRNFIGRKANRNGV